MQSLPLWLSIAAGLSLALAPLARAGEVATALRGSTLKIVGENEAVFFLTGLPNGTGLPILNYVKVVPEGATSINGAGAPVEYAGVKQIRISLGSGENVVRVLNLSVAGGLTLKGGPGAESFLLRDSRFGGHVSIDVDELGASVTCAGTNIAGNLAVKGSDDGDAVSLSHCAVGKSLAVSLGAGDDILGLTYSSSRSVAIKGGDGADALTWDHFASPGAANIDAGGGANSLDMIGSQVAKSFNFKSGAASDTISTEGCEFGDNVSLKLNQGDHEVTFMDTELSKNLILSAGSGDDIIRALGTTVLGGKLKGNLGGGFNAVTGF